MNWYDHLLVVVVIHKSIKDYDVRLSLVQLDFREGLVPFGWLRLVRGKPYPLIHVKCISALDFHTQRSDGEAHGRRCWRYKLSSPLVFYISAHFRRPPESPFWEFLLPKFQKP
ncbi:hypothetical protein CARUB_v10010701mg [Capsella rubella]|uniref:Uncharacterized protein n=1 Tax=Capsella rubella TaxID=81985 RepID=R0GSC8_9BRAS|nr:hypothetical protein CARUB_v10010701mg [Capsella rubella]